MGVTVLPTWMCIYLVSSEGVRFPATGVMVVCELSCKCSGQNWGPPQEQPWIAPPAMRTPFENLRSTKEPPLWEQPQNIGMCSLPLGGAKDWCLIHTLGAQGVKKKINSTAWTSMDVSFQNISVQEVPLGASTCSKIGTLKSAAMEAFECFPKKMSTKL